MMNLQLIYKRIPNNALKFLSTMVQCNEEKDSECKMYIPKCNPKCVTPPKKRGIVLGAYEGHTTHLTTSAEAFDTKCSGTLIKQICLATKGEIKPDSSYVFYNLGGFHTIVVVSIPKIFKNSNLENINLCKEAIRNSVGRGCQIMKQLDINDIYLDTYSDPEAAAEGSFLSTYRFEEFKRKKQDSICVNFYDTCGVDINKWYDGYVKANAQNIARRLMDTPSNVLTPTEFANCAKTLLCKPNISVCIYDRKWAEQQEMNAFLSVSQGSEEEPKFLEIHYGDTKKSPFVLIGKGVTFDSGGISLKVAKNMGNMKADMGGAAVIVAALWALSTLKVKANIVALIPLTENMPSECATKPGDVFTACNGKSIAVNNTDAEGRLLLADALAYSKKFNPKWIVDFATLTGSMRIALGNAASGVFSNSNNLYKHLENAAFETGDRVWRFPLWETYGKDISSSPFVDLTNIAKDPYGGACVAAAFLREFVPGCVDWMHVDMAGVFGPGSNCSYLTAQHMTGRPTRTLIDFLITQAKLDNENKEGELCP